ncbi:MAG: hypothetical protein FJY76_03705 [Candidatus Aenigmarchaeota archaeon]|nr:hypothetical protein [Candidatus Aenigmarchaeota archaeon]
MSEIEPLHVAVGALMMFSLFIAALLITNAAFAGSTQVHIEDESKMMERSALHRLEFCLKNGGDYLDPNFMDANRGRPPCEICGVCSKAASARVDGGAGNVWDFGSYAPPATEEEAQSMFVNIAKGEGIIIGRLTMKVKA